MGWGGGRYGVIKPMNMNKAEEQGEVFLCADFLGKGF